MDYVPLMCYCCIYKAPCKNVDLVYLSDLVWDLWWIRVLYIDNICCFHHHINITDKISDFWKNSSHSVYCELLSIVYKMAASKTNDHNKSQIQRHLSVHFSTSFTKGIVHSEVLEEIEKLVYKSLIQSIQITEKNLLSQFLTPPILLTRGIEIRNRYIKFADAERRVTNILIKVAPCSRLSNQVICAFMRNRDPIYATRELCSPSSNYDRIREVRCPNIRRQQHNAMSIFVHKLTTHHTVAWENLQWQKHGHVSGATARTIPLKIVPILITYVIIVARKAM